MREAGLSQDSYFWRVASESRAPPMPPSKKTPGVFDPDPHEEYLCSLCRILKPPSEYSANQLRHKSEEVRRCKDCVGPTPEPPARGEAQLPPVRISSSLAAALEAGAGDLVYVTDARAWLGGLRSAHAIVDAVFDDDSASIELGATTFDVVVSAGRRERQIVVERLY